VVAGTGRERVAEGEGGQRRVATRRPAPDAQALGVDPAPLGQPPGGGLTVVDVDDAPRAAQLVAVVAAIAGGPAVVDVDDGEPPAGPVLDAQLEHGARRSGRATVDDHDQWGQLAGRP